MLAAEVHVIRSGLKWGCDPVAQFPLRYAMCLDKDYDVAGTVMSMWRSSPKPNARDSRGLVVEIVVEEGHDARSIGNARGLILSDFGRRRVFFGMMRIFELGLGV